MDRVTAIREIGIDAAASGMLKDVMRKTGPRVYTLAEMRRMGGGHFWDKGHTQRDHRRRAANNFLIIHTEWESIRPDLKFHKFTVWVFDANASAGAQFHPLGETPTFQDGVEWAREQPTYEKHTQRGLAQKAFDLRFKPRA